MSLEPVPETPEPGAKNLSAQHLAYELLIIQQEVILKEMYEHTGATHDDRGTATPSELKDMIDIEDYIDRIRRRDAA